MPIEENTNSEIKCNDWYWVTKTYVDGVLVSEEEEFMGTTCDTVFVGGGGGTGGPGGTSDNTNGDFGESRDCRNCVVSGENFLALKQFVRNVGLVVYVPFPSSLRLPDGSVHFGNIIEIRKPNGALVVAYFSPNTTSSMFTVGYFYSIGPKGPGGTNSNPPIITSPTGGMWGFGSIQEGTSGGTYTRPVAFQAFLDLLELNASEIAFLDENFNISETLKNYLQTNGQTPKNIEFTKWAVSYLMENPDVSFSEIVEMNNIPISSITLPTLIDTTGLSPYPAFKSIVANLPNFINENPTVLAALSRYTGFTKTKIMLLIQPNNGPKIDLVSNLKDSYGRDLFGQYDDINKSLKIKKELVVGLDKVQSPNRYKALGMLLAIITLHEFVHYGRDVNKLTQRVKINGTLHEAGNTFELSISPPYNYSTIDRNNAIQWALFYKFNIND